MKSKKASGFGFEAQLSITGKGRYAAAYGLFLQERLPWAARNRPKTNDTISKYPSRHCTVTETAKQLNRRKSTISREIRRYHTQGRQYSAEKAQRQSRLAKRRKRKPYKLQRQHTDRRQGVRPRRYKKTPPSPAKIRKAHYRPWSNALPAIPSSAN